MPRVLTVFLQSDEGKRKTQKYLPKYLIFLMENRGFEPLTSALQGRRSPN